MTSPQASAVSQELLDDDRRHGSRFVQEADTVFAVLWRQPGGEILAEVHDESLHGLGLIVEAEAAVQVGEELSLIFQGCLLRGRVRHVHPDPAGRLHIGLECRPD